MKIITGACATLLVLSLVACGSSADDASTPAASDSASSPGVPTPQAGGGLGTWTVTTPAGVVAKATVPAPASDPLVAKAAQCVKAYDGTATFILIDVDATKSADDGTTQSGTIVTDDGKAIRFETPVTLLGDLYSEQPDSAKRAACAKTAGELADNQGEVPAGSKTTMVFAAREAVPSVKTLNLAVSFMDTPLTYTGS